MIDPSATNFALENRDAEIERLRLRNAALVECLSASLCPYNGQATGVTVGECQQCGCSHGLLIQPLTPHERGGAA